MSLMQLQANWLQSTETVDDKFLSFYNKSRSFQRQNKETEYYIKQVWITRTKSSLVHIYRTWFVPVRTVVDGKSASLVNRKDVE